MGDEPILNSAIAESLDDFSYAQSMAAAYVREQLMTPEERKAEERAGRITGIICGVLSALFIAAVGIMEVLA